MQCKKLSYYAEAYHCDDTGETNPDCEGCPSFVQCGIGEYGIGGKKE